MADLVADVTALRHRLHQTPETAGHEKQTAAHVKEWLAQRGLEPVCEQVGGHGLLYRIGDADGPAILLRADLDGLPLHEESGVPYASKNGGRHHACGHDGHAAILAGALASLAGTPPGGTVYGLFQPAEETGEGMARCLEDDRLSDLPIGRCYALHNLPGEPAGTVVVRTGVQAVASTGLRIRLQGKTSHAAEPHNGTNPIPIAARIVPEILASPGQRAEAVAALVGIHGGGERYGTSAGDAAVFATLRAGTDEDLDGMIDQVLQAAGGMAQQDGVVLQTQRIEPFPATHNDPDAVTAVRTAADDAGLPIQEPEHPFPWSEDFGHATARWPGALIGLGAGQETPPLHHPTYDFPDALLGPGIRLWTRLVREAA